MLSKDLAKVLIADYQERTANVQLIERQYTIEDSLNYVFVGLRRAGKSYLMYQMMQQLRKKGHSQEEFLYFNFEDDRLNMLKISDLDTIKISYEEMYNHKPIFFLDEIQIVDHWEKFARRLADQKYQVFITGSNAKMLSNEIATTLGGRYMIKNVFPYSFSEFLSANGLDIREKNAVYKYRNEIAKLHETFFYFGGMPEITPVSDKRGWLSNLFQKIFFGDLVSRYQIRNDTALRLLVKKLAKNTKQPSSYNRLANIVSSSGKKISTDTLIDYLTYLKESWLVFSLENFNSKFVERETKKKYYFIDNGLLNLFLIDPLTFLLENLVAIGLYQQYENEVYYYHNGVEVDFYLPEQKTAIQVSYSIADFDTRKREVDALQQISKYFDIEKYIIITKDEEDSIVENGIEIAIVPVWKWLLNFF